MSCAKALVRCAVLAIAVPPIVLVFAYANAMGWLFTGEVD